MLILAGLTFDAIQGCKPKDSTSAAMKSSGAASAEHNSFKEVTSKLDAGGSLYVYLGTEQWLTNLSTVVDQLHEMAASLPNAQDQHQAIDNAFAVGNHLIKDSGLQDISGIGISSIAREPGLYRNKFVVHHYPGQGDGFIWTIFGKKPHDLDGLNLLPANTALAAFYDVDSAEIWSLVKKQCEQSGFPQAQEGLKKFQDQFVRNMGIEWEQVIDSLDGEFGIVVTLDESHILKIPAGNQETFEVPEPAFMFVAKVKNDAIFKRIDIVMKQKGVPGVISSEKNGIQMRTVSVPVPVIPINFRPTFAQAGNYFFFATTDALIQEAIAVKDGKPGLKTSEEFKKLSADIPQKGNQFCFLSQRFSQTAMKLQQRAMNANNEVPQQLKDFMQSVLQPDKAAFTYSVGSSTDEGWITIANGNQSSGNLIAASAVVPAVFAAVALPAMAKAKETSQRTTCLNNLMAIQGAKQQWAMDQKKSASAVPTWQDIQQYLGGRGAGSMRCPKGGDYTLGSVADLPTCSMPGHVLPKPGQAGAAASRR